MRALDEDVKDTIWEALKGHLPERVDSHPLGCHRRRASDRDCFEVIIVRLTTGCSWVDAEKLTGGKVSDTTARSRRDEWIEAGIFDLLAKEALNAFDRIIGLDLSEVAIDGSLHKSPCGGEGTGKNPTDRAKLGWKWSIATDKFGIPIGYTIDGANRNDSVLLKPTLESVNEFGLVEDIETMWLDRGYDSNLTKERLDEYGITDRIIAKKSKRKSSTPKTNQPMGLRWPVERTNSWLSNFGQLRRNTDRKIIHRISQLALGVVFILTAKLIDWKNRWSPLPSPIR